MQKQSEAYIREIFTSIQGEGPFIGYPHIFVRFSNCNLNCKYCDTDFSLKKSKKYTIHQLYSEISKLDSDTISFTGGEPLLEIEFLKEFLCEYKQKLGKKIYLETNGTLNQNLKEIIDYIDVVAMDIKIKSATLQEDQYKLNEEFIKIAVQKETFVKVVFDENIVQNEIENIVNIVKPYCVTIVLQPKMPISPNNNIELIYNNFYKLYKNVRLIPQVHKFLNLL